MLTILVFLMFENFFIFYTLKMTNWAECVSVFLLPNRLFLALLQQKYILFIGSKIIHVFWFNMKGLSDLFSMFSKSPFLYFILRNKTNNPNQSAFFWWSPETYTHVCVRYCIQCMWERGHVKQRTQIDDMYKLFGKKQYFWYYVWEFCLL